MFDLETVTLVATTFLGEFNPTMIFLAMNLLNKKNESKFSFSEALRAAKRKIFGSANLKLVCDSKDTTMESVFRDVLWFTSTQGTDDQEHYRYDIAWTKKPRNGPNKRAQMEPTKISVFEKGRAFFFAKPDGARASVLISLDIKENRDPEGGTKNTFYLEIEGASKQIISDFLAVCTASHSAYQRDHHSVTFYTYDHPNECWQESLPPCNGHGFEALFIEPLVKRMFQDAAEEFRAGFPTHRLSNPKKCFLLHGPSGTGKSLSAYCFAVASKANAYLLPPLENVLNLNAVTDFAGALRRINTPAVIICNEFDRLVQKIMGEQVTYSGEKGPGLTNDDFSDEDDEREDEEAEEAVTTGRIRKRGRPRIQGAPILRNPRHKRLKVSAVASCRNFPMLEIIQNLLDGVLLRDVTIFLTTNNPSYLLDHKSSEVKAILSRIDAVIPIDPPSPAIMTEIVAEFGYHETVVRLEQPPAPGPVTPVRPPTTSTRKKSTRPSPVQAPVVTAPPAPHVPHADLRRIINRLESKVRPNEEEVGKMLAEYGFAFKPREIVPPLFISTEALTTVQDNWPVTPDYLSLQPSEDPLETPFEERQH